jgi:hypothetical protein
MHEMQIAFALKVSVRKCLRLVMFLGVVTGTRGKNYSPPYIKELFKGGDWASKFEAGEGLLGFIFRVLV